MTVSFRAAAPKDLSAPFRAWLRTASTETAAVELPAGVSSLAHLGLPRLFTVRVVPTLGARERWERERFVRFPPRCTLCERPPERSSSLLRSRGWWRAARPVLLDCIPQCAAHAALGPLLWFDVTPLGCDVAWHIVGACPRFLASAAELNAATERLPPWRAFPDYGPDAGGWRQGTGEHWRNTSWGPFWAALNAGERRAYLDRWPAPEAWRGAFEQWPGWGEADAATQRGPSSG